MFVETVYDNDSSRQHLRPTATAAFGDDVESTTACAAGTTASATDGRHAKSAKSTNV
jgi:hypothetical protein